MVLAGHTDFDGYRGQAIRDNRGAHLLSRNGKDSSRKFPRVFATIEEALPLYCRISCIATRTLPLVADGSRTSFSKFEETLTHTFLEFFVISLDAHKPLGVYLCAPQGPLLGPR